MAGAVETNALIVVDVQRAFFDGAAAIPEATTVLQAIRRLVDRARHSGVLVVQLQNDGPVGASDEADSDGWRLVIAPSADGVNEFVIRKSVDGGFERSKLAEMLRAAGADTVAICGVTSEMCVRATARAAMRHGFRVVLPHEAHGSYDIAAIPGVSEHVPAALVARVAEWALGDGVIAVPTTNDITFQPTRGS